MLLLRYQGPRLLPAVFAASSRETPRPTDTPRFERLFVRDLSELTYNSGVGMGMADVVTDRLVERINWEPTWINSLTANTPAAIRTPIHFPTDR